MAEPASAASRDAASPEPAGNPAAPSLEELAARAVAGDRDALGAVCAGLQDLVYRLSLRFTSDPQEAEDATQDILVQVITTLSSFEGRAKLTTWVYTIASRHLLQRRRGEVERSVVGAEAFGAWLDDNLADGPFDAAASEAEYRMLAGEVRIACTYGMLLTLSRDARIAYLLGDLVGFTDVEGAEVLGITPATFRQRLARARATMREVIAGRCGLVSAANPCRCDRQIASSIDHGILDRTGPVFANHPGVVDAIDATTIEAAARQLDAAEAIAAVYATDPAWSAPTAVLERLQAAAPALLA